MVAKLKNVIFLLSIDGILLNTCWIARFILLVIAPLIYCLEWDKWVLTNLSHEWQWFNTIIPRSHDFSVTTNYSMTQSKHSVHIPYPRVTCDVQPVNQHWHVIYMYVVMVSWSWTEKKRFNMKSDHLHLNSDKTTVYLGRFTPAAGQCLFFFLVANS